MKTLELAILAVVVFTSLLCKKNESAEPFEIRTIVGDYYVSPAGDDSNSGTEENPWKTIGKANEMVSSGETIVIKEGNYNEFITINKSGSADDDRIIFFSEALHGARCRGFKIQGKYISIDGFDIEAMGETNWVGIEVNSTSFIDILNCFVHECTTGGINIKFDSQNVKVKSNIIDHNGQWGINLNGSNCIIENNEISRTVQHHPKGDEPGFSGGDADGMRIFGSNHIIRSNTFKNIGDKEDSGNINPHVDCIQAWDGGTNHPLLSNIIIEGNLFSVSHPTAKGILIDANKGNACHNLMIRNNIFEFMDIGIGAYSGEFYDIFIYNNVFKATIGASSWGTSVYLKNVINYAYVNNITVDCDPEHRKIIGGSGITDFNLAWNSDGSKPSLTPELQAHDLISDPQFVSYTGSYGNSDYHILKTSPAINSALSIIDVKNDFDGTSRPQGAGYDRGAFEYHDGK